MIHLAEVTPNFGTGGIETRVARVLSGLPRSDFTICWAGLGSEPTDALQAIAGPISEMRAFQKRASPLRIDFRLLAELTGFLRANRPDVVRVHNYATSVYGILGARLAGAAHVIYESAGREHPDGPSVRQVALLRALGAQVDTVLTVCEFLAAEARESFGLPKEAIHVMPTGIDLQRFSAADRAKVRAGLGLPASAFVFGTTGIFRAVKRVEDVLSAGLEVLRERPDAHLLIVGADEWGVVPPAYWQAARAAGVAERCHFPGRIIGAESSIPAFDVFINSSVFEGASNAIVEAMAASAAIVATEVGGNPDIVAEGRTGFLVPPRAPEAIAAAVLRLARDPGLLARMSSEARRVAELKHSLSAMIKAYAELFRDLAQRPARTLTGEATATLQGLRRGVEAYLRGEGRSARAAL